MSEAETQTINGQDSGDARALVGNGAAPPAAPARQRLKIMPPIQLVGIGQIMQGAKAAFAAARDSFVDMGMEAAALKQDADDVTAQLRKHREDLHFEAKVGRNSTGGEGQ